MFGLKRKVRADEVEEVREEIKNLRLAKRKLEDSLEEIKLRKRLEAEEIKHMVKINEERKEHQVATRKIELEQEYNKRINTFTEEHTGKLVVLHKELHQKMESRFNTELGNLKELYKALMERMPNVTLALKKDL